MGKRGINEIRSAKLSTPVHISGCNTESDGKEKLELEVRTVAFKNLLLRNSMYIVYELCMYFILLICT